MELNSYKKLYLCYPMSHKCLTRATVLCTYQARTLHQPRHSGAIFSSSAFLAVARYVGSLEASPLADAVGKEIRAGARRKWLQNLTF